MQTPKETDAAADAEDAAVDIEAEVDAEDAADSKRRRKDPDPLKLIGSVMVRHRIERLLGSGGMGAVYEGVHLGLHRRDALKFCLVHANAEIKARAENEAQAMAKVSHPGICQVFDLDWTSDGMPVVVMELLQGRTFWNEIKRFKAKGERVPWERAVAVGTAVIEALGVAHQAGIVHRDMKPQNVFLADMPDGREVIKVMDFGLAKLRHVKMTMPGAWMGTIMFMAPEQFTRPSELDGRADLFAVGAMLYYAISGRFPYPPAKNWEEVAKRFETDPPPLIERVPEVPPHIGYAIDRLLSVFPEDRFSDASETLDALRGTLTSQMRTLAPRPPVGKWTYSRMVRLAPAEKDSAATQPARPSSSEQDRVADEKLLSLVRTRPDRKPVEKEKAAPLPRRERTVAFVVAALVLVGVGAAITRATIQPRSSSAVAQLGAAVTEPRERPERSPSAKLVPPVSAQPSPSPAVNGPAPPMPPAANVPAPGRAAPAAPTAADPALAPGKDGTVEVRAHPWAWVNVDGRRKGATTLRLTLAPGPHKFVFETKGHASQTRTVVIEPGSNPTIKVEWPTL